MPGMLVTRCMPGMLMTGCMPMMTGMLMISGMPNRMGMGCSGKCFEILQLVMLHLMLHLLLHPRLGERALRNRSLGSAVLVHHVHAGRGHINVLSLLGVDMKRHTILTSLARTHDFRLSRKKRL
mmetsp:Transcript_55623/g.90092  ORF Transcript_55623/g.90092 Transcript_55623/m.90092 type:complete len:124 (-) Transcript_55623:4482-4853(-)